MSKSAQACVWRLRRIAAGLRQLDVCLAVGISQARYSTLERGEAKPTEAERQEIELVLPPLSPEIEEQILCGGTP